MGLRQQLIAGEVEARQGWVLHCRWTASADRLNCPSSTRVFMAIPWSDGDDHGPDDQAVPAGAHSASGEHCSDLAGLHACPSTVPRLRRAEQMIPPRRSPSDGWQRQAGHWSFRGRHPQLQANTVRPDRVLDDGHREAARRPHAIKRGQPATKRAQARCSGQERCSDQDGRPFWPRHSGGKAWHRSRRVSLPRSG